MTVDTATKGRVMSCSDISITLNSIALLVSYRLIGEAFENRKTNRRTDSRALGKGRRTVMPRPKRLRPGKGSQR